MTRAILRTRAEERPQNCTYAAAVPTDPALAPAIAAAITAYVSELLEEAPPLSPTQQREVRMLLGAAADGVGDGVIPTAA